MTFIWHFTTDLWNTNMPRMISPFVVCAGTSGYTFDSPVMTKGWVLFYNCACSFIFHLASFSVAFFSCVSDVIELEFCF